MTVLHTYKRKSKSSQDSTCLVVVVENSEIKPVSVYYVLRNLVPAGHEVMLRVVSKTVPNESTPAVIEPRIVATNLSKHQDNIMC